MPRRDFLKLSCAAVALGFPPATLAAGKGHVSIVVDSENAAASSGPATRATGQLRRIIAAKGASCEIVQFREAAKGDICIVVAGVESQFAKGFPARGPLTAMESLRLTPGKVGTVPAVLVSATDPRGFVYGLLELAERVQFGENPVEALRLTQIIEEKPANEVRCVSRYFCGELEDKPWYDDKSFWSEYLDTLVASRFNRFTLAYGLEYDFPRGVTDDYFVFAYPYLVDVPGYPEVRVTQLAAADGTRLANPKPLSKEEREKNLEMLRFIASETGARGLQFQLGLWTHAYEWTDSPNAYHRITGLSPETHARYCRDALAMILKECPEIQGLTMRVHGESGIPEGSYSFWQTVFEAIAGAGRTIEIDMHAKGVDEKIIEVAVATGMPVKLGAKYSAEHQSLGYQQADIRALEIPHGDLSRNDAALFQVSSGSRSFTRYGYADFLREDAKYKLWFRLWPGTQRHLLSVDPEMAAAYARTASFCGATGLDLMEPLTFKGREGSGIAGGRCAYVDASLNPEKDWQKYELYYRVWGRKLYNPDADPETWRRTLRAEFGAGAEATETSLANASRILPLLTSAHLPSASNHDLWYELPTNMPIVLGSEPSPYGDTPKPKCFGTVSPLDPQMFSTVVEYSQALMARKADAKYSPVEVAQWLDQCVDNARRGLERARRTVRSRGGSAFRRIEEDVLIQIGLGKFFAHKLRSAVLYEVFTGTKDPDAGKLAIEHYQQARDAWMAMAERARGVYQANVSYGSIPKRSGHWSDRLPAIDTDLAAMKAKVQTDSAALQSRRSAADAIRAAIERPSKTRIACAFTPPQTFRPGQALALSLVTPGGDGESAVRSVRLRYRHVNQAERWGTLDAVGNDGIYAMSIPADYTESPYALEYYFELGDEMGKAWLHPGFDKTLSSQPYFAVSKRRT
ncbi:MAG TPA: hypothetical protein VGG46_08185 [Terriglobales bacterium]